MNLDLICRQTESQQNMITLARALTYCALVCICMQLDSASVYTYSSQTHVEAYCSTCLYLVVTSCCHDALQHDI